MASAATAGRHLYLLPVLLNLWMAAVSGIDVQIDPKCAKVGDTVTFSVLDAGNILFSEWYRGNTNNAEKQILAFVNAQNNGPQYIPGARGNADGSLVIPNIQKDHEGNYTVTIQNLQGQHNETVYLQVKDDCSKTSETGLSPGGIAGIVIAVLAVVAAVVGAVIYKFTRKGPEDM